MQSSNITLKHRIMQAVANLLGGPSEDNKPMPNRHYIPHSASGKSQTFKKNLRRVKKLQRRKAHFQGMKRRRSRV